jgi:hypothetical protein
MLVLDKPAVGVQAYVYVFSFAKVIDQFKSDPTSPSSSSLIHRHQLPLIFVLFKPEKLLPSGLKVPFAGIFVVLTVIFVAAAAEKVMLE